MTRHEVYGQSQWENQSVQFSPPFGTRVVVQQSVGKHEAQHDSAILRRCEHSSRERGRLYEVVGKTCIPMVPCTNESFCARCHCVEASTVERDTVRLPKLFYWARQFPQGGVVTGVGEEPILPCYSWRYANVTLVLQRDQRRVYTRANFERLRTGGAAVQRHSFSGNLCREIQRNQMDRLWNGVARATFEGYDGD